MSSLYFFGIQPLFLLLWTVLVFDIIHKTLKSDSQLERLLMKACEYANVYLFAKSRQKGCDGLGEMTNLKDEFKGVLDELIEYCQDKKYIADNLLYDLDLIADELSGLIKK